MPCHISERWLLRRVLQAIGASALSIGASGCSGGAQTREQPAPPKPSSAMDASMRPMLPADNPTQRIDASHPDAGRAPDAQPAMNSGQDVRCPATRMPTTEALAIRDLPECMGQNPYADVVCLQGPAIGNDAGRTCENLATPDECALRLFSCGLSSHAQDARCGPIAVGTDVCCYVVEGDCPVGRPFVVAGQARLARLIDGEQWCQPQHPSVNDLPAAVRLALAEVWRQDGLSEHASVASFSRFALQLMAQGAPAELVDAAHRAAGDEVRHARIAFGMAAAYDGRALSPGPLHTSDALEHGAGALEMAVSLASEGCIAETVSAQLVAASAERASDPAVREALVSIARDEADHVELAWRSLAWLLDRGDARVRSAAARVFQDAGQHVGFGAVARPGVQEEPLAAHGCLSVAERRKIAELTLRAVVIPAAQILFAKLDRQTQLDSGRTRLSEVATSCAVQRRPR